MSDYKYLKEKQEYIDRYDLFTIKECLEAIELCSKVYKEMITNEEGKKFSAGDKAKGSNWLTNQQLFYIKGKRYSRKEETIKKWMDEDSIEQDKYDHTPEPKDIYCSNCGIQMRSTLKHLKSYTDQPLRMLFFFECPSCKKRRGIYENGEEHISEPRLCLKCKSETKTSHKRVGNKITWTYTCSSCKFKEIEVDDLEKSSTEWKKKEEEDKQLLEKYREIFCSDKEGKESFEYIEAVKVGHEVYKEEIQKYDSVAYQTAISIKKLSIVELEKLLNKLLENEEYIKLSLNAPEIGQHVIVPFTIQDADSSRKQHTSIIHVQKLIKDALEETNWRLVGNSIIYRLGYISGRLKGYESEEDFLELAGKKKEQKIPKIDDEKKMKYSGHNVVQLARLMGEMKGIENLRKRRLEKEPEGFFLGENEGSYTCGICRENTPGNKIWWNLDGLRCSDCKRNIQEGVIPALTRENESNWMRDWEIKYEFSIHASTVKKLKKEGVLHGRELKRKDGTAYCTVYLADENKEFLEKYPRKPKIRMTITDLLGNTIEL